MQLQNKSSRHQKNLPDYDLVIPHGLPHRGQSGEGSAVQLLMPQLLERLQANKPPFLGDVELIVHPEGLGVEFVHPSLEPGSILGIRGNDVVVSVRLKGVAGWMAKKHVINTVRDIIEDTLEDVLSY